MSQSGYDCAAAVITTAIDILGLVPGAGCPIQIAGYFAGQVSAFSTAVSDPTIFSGVQVFTSTIVAGLRFSEKCVVDSIPIVQQIVGAVEIALDIKRVSIECDGVFEEQAQTFLNVSPVGSWDPNEKVGSKGVGEKQYLSVEEPLRYVIFFENMEIATAPAQEVIITDQLDMENMDMNTLSLGPISFGTEQVIPPSGLSYFATDVDLRPDNDLIVRIDATLNKSTGLLT